LPPRGRSGPSGRAWSADHCHRPRCTGWQHRSGSARRRGTRCPRDGTGPGVVYWRASTVTFTLTNNPPATGLAPYVTARVDTHSYPVKVGDNRLEVSYFATQGARLQSVTLAGRPGSAVIGSERGHPVYAVDVELPRGTSRTIVLHLSEPAGTGAPIVPTPVPWSVRCRSRSTTPSAAEISSLPQVRDVASAWPPGRHALSELPVRTRRRAQRRARAVRPAREPACGARTHLSPSGGGHPKKHALHAGMAQHHHPAGTGGPSHSWISPRSGVAVACHQ
jgi:hypothetical protein